MEKATFTPLVFTATGGMAPECTRYHKKIAELISSKTKEEYSHVMNHTYASVYSIYFVEKHSHCNPWREGVPKRKEKVTKDISELSFNMIPSMLKLCLNYCLSRS